MASNYPIRSAPNDCFCGHSNGLHFTQQTATFAGTATAAGTATTTVAGTPLTTAVTLNMTAAQAAAAVVATLTAAGIEAAASGSVVTITSVSLFTLTVSTTATGQTYTAGGANSVGVCLQCKQSTQSDTHTFAPPDAFVDAPTPQRLSVQP